MISIRKLSEEELGGSPTLNSGNIETKTTESGSCDYSCVQRPMLTMEIKSDSNDDVINEQDNVTVPSKDTGHDHDDEVVLTCSKEKLHVHSDSILNHEGGIKCKKEENKSCGDDVLEKVSDVNEDSHQYKIEDHSGTQDVHQDKVINIDNDGGSLDVQQTQIGQGIDEEVNNQKKNDYDDDVTKGKESVTIEDCGKVRPSSGDDLNENKK